MKVLSSRKANTVNAAVWAITIVVSSFVIHVLEEPDILPFVLVAGYFATTGLFAASRKTEE